jgi:hypothetical protein
MTNLLMQCPFLAIVRVVVGDQLLLYLMTFSSTLRGQVSDLQLINLSIIELDTSYIVVQKQSVNS